MLRLFGQWIIHFDFRYYKTRIKHIFNAAKEFFEITEYALHQNKMHVFIDNAYSTVELLVFMSNLQYGGFQKFHEKRKHREIQRRYKLVCLISGIFKEGI